MKRVKVENLQPGDIIRLEHRDGRLAGPSTLLSVHHSYHSREEAMDFNVCILNHQGQVETHWAWAFAKVMFVHRGRKKRIG